MSPRSEQPWLGMVEIVAQRDRMARWGLPGWPPAALLAPLSYLPPPRHILPKQLLPCLLAVTITAAACISFNDLGVGIPGQFHALVEIQVSPQLPKPKR